MDYKETVNHIFLKLLFDGSDTKTQVNDMFNKSSTASAYVRKEANQIYATKGHNKDIHRLLMTLYSKCIALAPNDSEELAFGYDNRSALMKHLGKHKEAIIDVERALKITKSRDLEMKLLSRKMECLKLIDNDDGDKKLKCINSKHLETSYEFINQMYMKVDKTLPKLPDWKCIYGDGKKLQLPKIIQSENISSIADCVSLKYNEKFGKHMIANRDIKPGEIIAVEKGLVVIPFCHQQYLVCSHCLDFAWNGIPCEYCACIIYCSEKCKEEAWVEYHDIECLILPHLYTNAMLLNITAITTRLFLKFVKKEGLHKIINDFKVVCSEDKKDDKSFFEQVDCSEQLQSFHNFVTFYKDISVRRMTDDLVVSMIFSCLSKYTNIFNNLKYLGDFESYNEAEACIKKLFLKLEHIILNNQFDFKIKMNADCDCQKNKSCCRKIGTIFAPVCSFFHHSCIFNTSRIFTNNGKIVLFTLTPVKKGEQLCVCYGPDLFDDKESRNNRLKQNFNFICNCQACTENWPKRRTDFMLQDMLGINVTDKTMKLYKLMCKENINLHSFYDFDRNYCSNKMLQDNVKVVEMCYENYGSLCADLMSINFQLNIEEALDGLYGYEYEMKDKC